MYIHAPIPTLHHILMSFDEVLHICHRFHSVGFIITMVIVRNAIIISAIIVNL